MKKIRLDVKLIEPSSIMVCPLTLEKWEYHQCLIELPLYLKRNLSKLLIVRREMAESFLQHRAIQAGGARPQRDGGDRGGGGGGGGGDGGGKRAEGGLAQFDGWQLEPNYQSQTFGGTFFLQRINNLILMRNAQASVS